MSDVASLELCKELYALSGWGYNETDKIWCHGKLKSKGLIDTREVHEHLPAYALGYLLRKLPNTITDRLVISRFKNEWVLVTAEGESDGRSTVVEDAACKLAIELFKAGVLERAA